MAADMDISNVGAKAAVDALVDLLDAGAAAAYIKIYAGTKPAGGPDAGLGGATELVQITLADPAFGNAADTNPGARATANGMPKSGTATGTGTATFFRAFDSNDVPLIDGTVGTSSADMIIDNTSIASGQTVNVTAWTIDHAEGQ